MHREDDIVTPFLEDPEGTFRAAVDAADPVRLAVGSVLDPDMGGPRAAERFAALVESRGTEELTGALALGILSNADHMKEELVEAARQFIESRWKDIPLSPGRGDLVARLVRTRDEPDVRRMTLLRWLWGAKPEEALAISKEIVADEEEPFGATVRQAITILGGGLAEEVVGLLKRYAERHLDPPSSPPPAPQPDPAGSLHVLNSLSRVGQPEMELLHSVLEKAAARDLEVRGGLDHLIDRLTLPQIRERVENLNEGGHAAWLPTSLLPQLLRLRGGELAETLDEEWWPEECLAIFAKFDWHTLDDKLYVTVLKRIHRTTNEPARAAIRTAVRVRCEATSPDGSGRMRRLGARALLELCLQGTIEVSDEDMAITLRLLGSDALMDEVRRVGWKKPDRARILAAALGSIDPDLIPQAFSVALAMGDSPAIGFLEGVPQTALDTHAEELAASSDRREAALGRLCSLSEGAAVFTRERWAKGYAMADFRALAGSARAEDRLEAVPQAVRSYGVVTSKDRAELLRALAHTQQQRDLLLDVLADRKNPPGSSPADQDLIIAIGLLAEHLRDDEGGRTLEALQGICREVTQAPVRQAAYGALSEANPSEELVDLLLERRDGEVPALRPTVEEALSRLADKLEAWADDEAGPSRALAVKQLARIESGRAAAHARDLLRAPDIHDRRVGAEILGETGVQEDADLLEAAVEHEPNPDVRRELHRAIRRLKIGDLAAAHERLGELADINDPTWATADPKQLFDRWTEPLVTGLNRIAQAETNEDWGTAIDQLNEVAKALLYRAIELAGTSIGIKQGDVVAAASNELDYGAVVARQQILDKWRWVRHLSALYELRTEHIATRGKVEAPAKRTPEDWPLAKNLFKLGVGECCMLILEAST